MIRRSVLRPLGVLACVWLASPAAAQTQPKPAPPPAAAKPAKPANTIKKTGWQADFHAGFLPGGTAQAGVGSLPPAGPTFPTNIPGLFSRNVASYFFGDGALLFNTAAANNNLTPARIVPLDPVLTTPSAQRQGGATYGFRIGHTVTSHALAEFSMDLGQGHMALSSDALAAVEATRASYKALFDGQLVGTAGNAVTTVTSDIHDKGGSQMLLLGDLNINVGTFGRVTPFVTLGGGVLLARGTPTSFTMTGHYTFNLNLPGNAGNGAPFNETDSITVTFETSSSIIKVFGGGAQFMVNKRSGIRVDARVHLATGGLKIRVTTNPAIVIGSPQSVIDRGLGSPQVQFGTLPDKSSSLVSMSDDFKTFESSGTQKVVTVTFGYFVRF